MIKIVYSRNKNGIVTECLITGSVKELREVKTAIMTLRKSENTEVVIEADKNFSPDEQALGRIIIKKNDSPLTRASFENSHELWITGNNNSLFSVASFFSFKKSTPSGHHTHHEYWEGNEYIASDSVPLVIMVE